MGRIYTAVFSAVAVTADQDLFEVNAPATGMVVIHRVHIGQSSDPADAEAEMLQIQLNRGAGSAGSGGTSPTAAPHSVGSAAFGGTVEVNNTTQSAESSGAQTVIFDECFNVQAGFYHEPAPAARIVVPPSGIFIVNLPEAPADSLTMSGSITFEELD